MARKRYYLVLLMGLILLFQSCSTDDASFDAVVISPGDPGGCTFDGNGLSTFFFCGTIGPMVFKVEKSSSDTTPVANANVRIDIGGANNGALLLDRTGSKCYLGSTVPPAFLSGGSLVGAPADCFSVDTQTDQLGVVQFQMVGRLFGCGTSTAAIAGSTAAQVTSSASFASSSQTISISCGTPPTTTTTLPCAHPLHYIHFLLFFLLVLAMLLWENFGGARKHSA